MFNPKNCCKALRNTYWSDPGIRGPGKPYLGSRGQKSTPGPRTQSRIRNVAFKKKFLDPFGYSRPTGYSRPIRIPILDKKNT
jgi:hypothetical protein